MKTDSRYPDDALLFEIVLDNKSEPVGTVVEFCGYEQSFGGGIRAVAAYGEQRTDHDPIGPWYFGPAQLRPLTKAAKELYEAMVAREASIDPLEMVKAATDIFGSFFATVGTPPAEDEHPKAGILGAKATVVRA